LASLVSAAQQHDDRVTALLKINPVTGAIVNAKFADAFTYWGNITSQTFRQAHQPRRYDGSRAKVFELCFPKPESLGLFEFHRFR
jgi:hypothetical protein